jgi:hypothetical protein
MIPPAVPPAPDAVPQAGLDGAVRIGPDAVVGTGGVRRIGRVRIGPAPVAGGWSGSAAGAGRGRPG